MAGIEKYEMELFVIKTFLECYNTQFDLDYEVLSKPEKPDFIIESRSKKDRMGVEITLAIIRDKDNLPARKLYNRPDTILPLKDVPKMKYTKYRKFSGPAHSSNEFCPIIYDRINDKIEKAKDYNLDYPLILVIGAGDPLLGKSDFENFVLTEFIRPVKNLFDEIWICIFNHVEKSENGILRIL